jgi:hypothetical protein
VKDFQHQSVGIPKSPKNFTKSWNNYAKDHTVSYSLEDSVRAGRALEIKRE